MIRPRQWRTVAALAAVLALMAAACGDDSDDTSTSDTSTDGAAPSGETIQVGVLHSLSGTMAISETAVRDSTLLAIQEINEAGGVLGHQIEPIIEDGASDWPTFAEKSEKLLGSDDVAVVFGCWTSASRKAVLPVFEGMNGLLFYPVQYEGLEASPNIVYTGATTNQQIIPALDYLREEGHEQIYLVGSDYVFPRTANMIIRAYAEAHDMEILGEDYIPLGETDTTTLVSNVINASPDAVFNTLNGDSNVAFFTELTSRGITSDDIPTISVSVAEEEITGIGVENIEGHLVAWNYYMTTDTARNEEFVASFQAEYGADRVTADPIEAAYNSVYIWAAAVEAAGSFDVDDVRAALPGIEITAPGGTITVHDTNQHISKTARIGIINADGLIDEVWSSGEPIVPDPFLDSYDWAADLPREAES